MKRVLCTGLLALALAGIACNEQTDTSSEGERAAGEAPDAAEPFDAGEAVDAASSDAPASPAPGDGGALEAGDPDAAEPDAAGPGSSPPGELCDSHADCDDSSYAPNVYCKPSVCGRRPGVCAERPEVCPDKWDLVCGCDGQTYVNQCVADSWAAGFAYGGPSRSGALNACGPDVPCAKGQVCIDDPGAPGGGQDSPGICVDTSGTECGPTSWSDGGVVARCGSKTQLCVAAQSCTGEGCDVCVFTTGAACGAGVACPQGEVCVPAFDCNGGTCGQCAVP